MDQEQIRTVLAVERYGSFTLAADMLHVTQSTVTARIRHLERELGVAIWERTTRRLVLTSEGKKLMALFERMDNLFERMRGVADSSGFARHVVFGSVHSQWSSGILPLLRAWAEQQPSVTWRLITGHSRELIEWVRDGSLDAAITYFPAHEHGLLSELLAEQPLRLLGASILGLPDGSPLTTDQVKQHRLAYVEWGAPFTEWYRQEFDGWIPAIQVDQAPLLVQLLTNGGYLGFMPAALARTALNQGVLSEVPYLSETPLPARSVHLISSERALARPMVRDLWSHVLERGSSAFL